MMIRGMTLEDYDQVYELWSGIRGFGIRAEDDSREGVERFIRRNPGTCVVAEEDGRIIGSVLCGHDGRRGCMYHVCVAEGYRQQGVGHKLVLEALERLRKEGINQVNLVAFRSNAIGNEFWKKSGWVFRKDIHYYEFSLNENNIVRFVE